MPRWPEEQRRARRQLQHVKTESVCPQRVDQVDKKHPCAKQMTGGCAEACGEESVRAARGKQQHDQKQQSKGSEGCGKSVAAETEPHGVEYANESQNGPQAEGGKKAELARGSQGRIVT